MPDREQPEILAEGRFLRLVRCGRWEHAERVNAAGAVVVLAITGDQTIVLTEQYRIPHGRAVIELPAGLIGDMPELVDDDVETAARRELLEETGYEAERIEYLTEGPTSAGLSNEVITIVRATGLRKVGAGGGVDAERIAVHEIPLAEAHRWLNERMSAGVAVDPKVFAGLYFAGARPAD